MNPSRLVPIKTEVLIAMLLLRLTRNGLQQEGTLTAKHGARITGAVIHGYQDITDSLGQ